MSLTACAQIVERGDPDRFLATMAAPPALREILFPLYAFNVEVARAPWVTQEPMIGEMRLQWWRDVLEEIAQGGEVRRQEVASPLATVLDAQAARDLDTGIEARRWDLYRDPFADEAAFWTHLRDTSGRLLWTAARLAGAAETQCSAIHDLGTAQGLANWFMAVPKLEDAGRLPLVDGRPEAIAELARKGVQMTQGLRLRGATLAAWQARPVLNQIAKDPHRVANGAVGLSEFGKRWRLLVA